MLPRGPILRLLRVKRPGDVGKTGVEHIGESLFSVMDKA